jgi:RNA polymerase sigma factor (sigma-70 family)
MVADELEPGALAGQFAHLISPIGRLRLYPVPLVRCGCGAIEVKVVPHGGGSGGLRQLEGDPQAAQELQDESSLGDTLLSWVIRGVRVDRRRRLGAHRGLRQLLADDASATLASEPWRAVASALHRQALSQGLRQLRPREKEVVRLAYLEGRTNREIADRLGISVSTVRRRLRVALRDMEAFMRRTGGSLSAFVILAVSQLAARSAKIGRTLWSSTQAMHSVAALGTAGAAIVGTVAVVVLAPLSAAPTSLGPGRTHATPPLAIRQGGPPAPSVGATSSPSAGSGLPGSDHGNSSARSGEDEAGAPVQSGAPAAPAVKGDHSNRGCDGNPTSAPPDVPVGPRKNHPTGAPVSHPTAGGCRT